MRILLIFLGAFSAQILGAEETVSLSARISSLSIIQSSNSLSASGIYSIPAIDPQDFEISSLSVSHRVGAAASWWDTNPGKPPFIPAGGTQGGDVFVSYSINTPGASFNQSAFKAFSCGTGSYSVGLVTIQDEQQILEASELYESGTLNEITFSFSISASVQRPAESVENFAALVAWNRPTFTFVLARKNTSAAMPEHSSATPDLADTTMFVGEAAAHPSFFEEKVVEDFVKRGLPIDFEFTGSKKLLISFRSFEGYRYLLYSGEQPGLGTSIHEFFGDGEQKVFEIDESANVHDKKFFWVEEVRENDD